MLSGAVDQFSAAAAQRGVCMFMENCS